MRPGRVVAAVVLAVSCLVLGVLIGWYTVAYLGLAVMLLGWLVYAVLASVTVAVAAFAASDAKPLGVKAITFVVFIAVLAVFGGPASCTGSLVWKGDCERKHDNRSNLEIWECL